MFPPKPAAVSSIKLVKIFRGTSAGTCSGEATGDQEKQLGVSKFGLV